jgi:NAD+ synthase (glutamine-hydrolysing)
LDTPISPELLPPKDGVVSQITEDTVGPYELHDFFIYNAIRRGFSPKKVVFLAVHAFQGIYDEATVTAWLRVFYRRFFAQQYKRSSMPDGGKAGPISLSPRGEWRMPSDAVCTAWEKELIS